MYAWEIMCKLFSLIFLFFAFLFTFVVVERDELDDDPISYLFSEIISAFRSEKFRSSKISRRSFVILRLANPFYYYRTVFNMYFCRWSFVDRSRQLYWMYIALNGFCVYSDICKL